MDERVPHAEAAPAQVSGQAWGWALAALAATVLGFATPVGVLSLPTALLLTVPLMMRADPVVFARTCLVIGALLLPFALAAAFLHEAYPLLPSPLMLLAAAFAAPHDRPSARWTLGLVVAPLAAVGLGALILCLALRALAWP
ncbi:hypothetical protein ACFXJO_16780 [Streptomyces lavendulae]|uniref:hypothetical protein n=1 Tax=Streptomyces lavendulae TaxID=1914 RepID=UPI0036AD4727